MTDIEQRLKPYEGSLTVLYILFFVIGCAVLIHIVRKYGRRIRTEWPDAVRLIAARPWQWTDPAIVIIPTILLGGSFAWFAHDRFAPERFLPIAIALILTHAPIIIAAGCILFARNVGPRAAFGGGSHRFLPDLALGTGLYFAMITIVLPYMIGSGIIMHWLGHEPAPQDIVEIFAKQAGLYAKVFFASWTVLVAPIAEEIIFRGILLPLLLRKFKAGLVIPAISIVFALLHGDATAFLPLFAVSTCLCIAYIVTGSITVTITMHALFNSVTTAILLLTN